MEVARAYNVTIRSELEGEGAFCVLDLFEALEKGKVTVDPVVVHARDGILDLFDDAKNGLVSYTASLVSQGDYDRSGWRTV